MLFLGLLNTLPLTQAIPICYKVLCLIAAAACVAAGTPLCHYFRYHRYHPWQPIDWFDVIHCMHFRFSACDVHDRTATNIGMGSGASKTALALTIAWTRAWETLYETTTHLMNASSPRSLILTVSLLWFNFRIARDSRATR